MISKGKNHFGDRLFQSIRRKGNYLCLGIDPHLNLIPKVFQNKIKITRTPYSQNNVIGTMQENKILQFLKKFLK